MRILQTNCRMPVPACGGRLRPGIRRWLALAAVLLGSAHAAAPERASADKAATPPPEKANWFTHPWSALQGKSPPKPPPKPAEPIPEYPRVRLPILDSGFPVTDDEHLWWLDNARVVFKGYEIGSYDPDWEKKTLAERRADGREKGLRVGHYIWDTRKNTVTLFRRRLWNYCFEDGVSAFLELPVKEAPPPAKITPFWIGPLTLWMGPFGKERPRPEIDPNYLSDNRSLREHCGLITPGAYEAKTIPLKKGWGILRYGHPDEPMSYTPPKGPPVALPIMSAKRGRALYAPWRDQYLLIETYNQSSVMPAIWWLSKDGRTQAIPIPNTGYLSATFYPIQPGVLMIGRWRPDESLRSTPESYVLGNDDSVRSLGRFSLDKYGVSPNGCRLAYREYRCGEGQAGSVDPGAPKNYGCLTAQMIDFCPKGETP